MDRLEYEGLKPFCKTEAQAEKLRITFEVGSMQGAARKLGIAYNAVFCTIQSIKREAARRGFSPDDDAAGLAPPGFVVRGKSTLHGPDGSVKMQWVKTREDVAQQWEALVASMSEAADGLKGLAPATKAPKHTDSDLLAIYPYGDPHIGMYAYHGDAEADFDLKKAVDLFTSCTQQLVDSVPPAEQALVCFLGDFFHSDNQSNRTARSGFQLDVDSRWSKVLSVGVNIAVSLIRLALLKHKRVHVITEIGNHDDHSAIMLAVCMDAFFKDDPRVTIDLSPARFHYYEFGANLIGTHHGDLVKPQGLPGTMATDKAQEWGRAKHRVWYTGHIHNQTRYDLAGCEVESFRILPPRDAYAQSNGYRSGRSMDCIIRHRDRGEIARHTVHAA